MSTAHLDVRHGWTLARLDTVTSKAISRRSQLAMCDRDERYAAGWHAAVELLYTSTTAPSEQELIRAAQAAADTHTQRTAEQRGVPRTRGDDYEGRADYPRWWAYWHTTCAPTPSLEETVVERLALAQVWARLSPDHQTALLALAVHGSYQAAADSLGLNRAALYARVGKARHRVLRMWWEGETPRRAWTDRRHTTTRPYRASASARIRRRRRDGAA